MPTLREQPVDLEDYLGVIKGRKWTVIFIVMLVTSASLLYSFSQTALYQAHSRLFVKPVLLNDQNGTPEMETESQLVASEQVAQRAAKGLHESADRLLDGLSVEPAGNSSVLVVSYTSPDPQMAASAANSFADNYIKYRREQALQRLGVAREDTEVRIRSVESQLKSLLQEINEARAAADEGRVNSLEADMLSLSARRGLLEKELEDLQQGQTARLGGGEVIQRAVVPGSPLRPNHLTTGGLGALFGLGLGVAAAFVRQRLSRRFGSPVEIEQIVRAPLLSTIPKFKVRRVNKKGASLLVTLDKPRSGASEAYRTLRTSLEVAMGRADLKSLLITSPSAGEGKTITAANLSVAFAQAGRKVALISGDLRRPGLEKYFEILNDGSSGLSTWLAGSGTIMPSLHASPISNLDILPSGPIPSNPPELLASWRMRSLVEQLSKIYDLIIVDSAPVLPAADTLGLASHLGGIVMVIDAGTTRRSHTRHARERLGQIGTSVLGSVLNSYEASLPYYAYVGTYYSSGWTTAVPDASNGRERHHASAP